jgi:hypothetical protein
MSAPTPTRLTGRALGEAVLAVVEVHPEVHYQPQVTCGTEACIAGWAMSLHLGIEPGENIDARRDGDLEGTWVDLYERYEGGAETVAIALLFGEGKQFDQSLRERFINEVFGVQGEREAIDGLRGMLDLMPETVTA